MILTSPATRLYSFMVLDKAGSSVRKGCAITHFLVANATDLASSRGFIAKSGYYHWERPCLGISQGRNHTKDLTKKRQLRPFKRLHEGEDRYERAP